MKLKDTRITMAGVFRCCLSNVALDLKEVEVGDRATCEHCKEVFELIEDKETKDKIWKPVWQLTTTSSTK